jgi:hypothetical protein
MKKLYSFTLNEEIEELVEEKSKDSEGNEVTTKKPVTESKSREFFLKKPTRKMYDEAELFYGVVLSDGIKAGLLTRALLAKRFDNDGGVLNEDDKKRYSAMYFSMFELQNQFQRLSLTPEKDRSEDEQGEFKDVVQNILYTKERIQDFESSQSSLFEQTAENRARNKTILWWTLMLAHEELRDEEGGISTQRFFGDGDHDLRLQQYDEFEESEDEFVEEVMRKFAYFVSFWYVGKANKQEDFEELARDVAAATEEADDDTGVDTVLDELAKEALVAEGALDDFPKPPSETEEEAEPEAEPEPEEEPEPEPEPEPEAESDLEQENNLGTENSEDETTNEKPSE